MVEQNPDAYDIMINDEKQKDLMIGGDIARGGSTAHAAESLGVCCLLACVPAWAGGVLDVGHHDVVIT